MIAFMKIDLSDKVAIVTGASGQLGRVIARTLADCGAAVAIHYHQNEAKALELCKEIQAKNPQSKNLQCMVVQADVTDLDSILRMKDKVLQTLGAPQIVVNNAVIQYGPWKEVLDEDPAVYEHQFRSCVLQNVFMAKAFAPAMIKKEYGRIIAINTECAMQNFPTQSGYVAGKRGMDGVLRVLAKEIGKHQITVNQVAPGWIETEKERKKLFKKTEPYCQTVPLRRRGTEQEVANLVAFLASDLSSFITGCYIPVSGGNVMPTI